MGCLAHFSLVALIVLSQETATLRSWVGGVGVIYKVEANAHSKNDLATPKPRLSGSNHRILKHRNPAQS